MFKQIKPLMVLPFILISACLGVKKEIKDVSAISSIDLGTTNTKLNLLDGSKISDYDLRVSVRTKEDTGVQVQSITVTTPSGASFTCERDDNGAIDQKDPEYGMEVIRDVELEGNESVWTLGVIANLAYELFGDVLYTRTEQ